MLDMREHDVPYHMRFQIDADVRCGHWFAVRAAHGQVTLTRRADLLQRAEPRICAFDIETTKLPLQFPNAEFDQACPTLSSSWADASSPSLHEQQSMLPQQV